MIKFEIRFNNNYILKNIFVFIRLDKFKIFDHNIGHFRPLFSAIFENLFQNYFRTYFRIPKQTKFRNWVLEQKKTGNFRPKFSQNFHFVRKFNRKIETVTETANRSQWCCVVNARLHSNKLWTNFNNFGSTSMKCVV